MLYAADRSQHVNEIIRPTLNKGDWVISDRFCGSTLAYQGYGRKLDIKLIKDLETIATQGISPDITFLLDIPVEESIKRRINRKNDRIEKEGREFLSNVSLGFQELSENKKWKKISAINSKENIMSEIQSEIKKLIKKSKMNDFKNIYGQDLAIEILKSAISKEHISPAYLFSGPEGVGRKKLLKFLLKLLLTKI